jgi:hypothetical protein
MAIVVASGWPSIGSQAQRPNVAGTANGFAYLRAVALERVVHPAQTLERVARAASGPVCEVSLREIGRVPNELGGRLVGDLTFYSDEHD